VCVGPDLDSTTALACLKELREKCLYLHFDGVKYCFKKDPNETLLVEQEADSIARDRNRVRSKIKEMLEHRLAGHHDAIVWPEKTTEVPHEDQRFLIAYMPLEFAGKPRSWQEEKAREFFEKYGDKPRKHRNGLALAIPSDDQIEVLRRSVQYHMAVDQVMAKSKQVNLTNEQSSRLRERKATEKAAAESAFVKLYTEVWFPRVEGGKLEIESVAVGGRPLLTTLNDKREAAIHERVLELITQVQRCVFSTVKPQKIADSFKLGQGEPPRVGISVSDVVEGFFSFPGFPRLSAASVVQKGIAQGIADGVFGYFSGPPPTLGGNGKYAVAPEKVRINVSVSHDEIDVDTGFVMLPSSVPQPAPAIPTGGAAAGGDGSQPASTGGLPTGGGEPTPVIAETETSAGEGEKSVKLSFAADRNSLYTAWNAIANLADMAGRVKVTIEAESLEGFDRTKLENGVMEPLREEDLIE